MNTRTPSRPGLWAYAISFITGAGGAVIFWLLRTPTPVPPLIGLVGLLGIAFGEIGMSWLLRRMKRNRAGGKTEAAGSGARES